MSNPPDRATRFRECAEELRHAAELTEDKEKKSSLICDLKWTTDAGIVVSTSDPVLLDLAKSGRVLRIRAIV